MVARCRSPAVPSAVMLSAVPLTISPRPTQWPPHSCDRSGQRRHRKTSDNRRDKCSPCRKTCSRGEKERETDRDAVVDTDEFHLTPCSHSLAHTLRDTECSGRLEATNTLYRFHSFRAFPPISCVFDFSFSFSFSRSFFFIHRFLTFNSLNASFNTGNLVNIQFPSSLHLFLSSCKSLLFLFVFSFRFRIHFC